MEALLSIFFASLRLVEGCLCGNGNLWPRISIRRYFLANIMYFESSSDGDDICNGNYQGRHLIGLGKLDQYMNR